MSDIVERLEKIGTDIVWTTETINLCHEAAADIKLLRVQIQTLGDDLRLAWRREGAFRRFMEVCAEGSSRGRAIDLIDKHEWELARCALEPKP